MSTLIYSPETGWDIEAILERAIDPESYDVSLIDQFLEIYTGNFSEIIGGHINIHGVFSFPGDSAQKPIAKVYMLDESIYYYKHNIIAFGKGEEFLVGRLI